MDQTTLFDYAAPSGAELELPSSSQAILAVRYELRPSLIAMVQENPFQEKEMKIPIPTYMILSSFARAFTSKG